MKKLSLILCVICLFTMCAMPTFAADYKIGIEVTNVAEDIITVSGAASVDNLVTVLILNPGKGEADVTGEAAADTAVQYFGAALSKGGKFKTDVKINTVDGGVFTVVVKTATGKYTDTFSFYPYGKKMGDVEALKGEDADALALKLPGILENYGYAKHPLFADITEKELAEEIVSQNGEYPLETPEDADTFLRKMLVLAAFNAGSEALTESGRFDYASELGLLDNDWYIDYTRGILSEEGYEKLHEEWISESYNDFDEIVAEFEELMCYYAVVYNALSGGGHVEELLEKYEEQYEDAGFKLSLVDSATGKKQLFAKLVAAKPASLSALADKFNSLFKKKTNTSSGGGSGSSAPVSGAGGGGYIAPATPSTPSAPQTPSTPSAPAYPFKDMESVAWAKDAVKALYDSGVINGRSEGIFAPSENVTRAELTKMIASLVNKDEKIKIAAVGDSLTQGLMGDDGKYTTELSYPAYLQESLGEEFEVKNFGLSAYGIYEGHKYSYTANEEYKNSLEYNPDIVIIIFGTNDAKTDYWGEIKANYKKMYSDFVDKYLELSSKPEIILGIPGPCFEGEYLATRPAENMEEMREIIRSVAAEKGLKTVDLNANFGERKEYFPDGLHFNVEGGKDMANAFCDVIKSNAKFEDVSENDWFFSFVTDAAERKIVLGSEGRFYPANDVTREDAAVIIARVLGKESSDALTFTDAADTSDYAKSAIAALTAEKIINGVGDNKFAPKMNLTRAQAAVLIYNALGGAAK